MLGPEFPRDKWLCPQQNWGYPPGIPHPLLSDPWFAERIDKAVQKYGAGWTPEQVEAFREQMAWTLATHPRANVTVRVGRPPETGQSGARSSQWMEEALREDGQSASRNRNEAEAPGALPAR